MLGSPPDIDLEDIRNTLSEIDGVIDVHHIHLWHIDEEKISVEAHLEIGDTSPETMQHVISQARTLIQERHGVSHGTFQLEPRMIDCSDEICAS